MAKINIKNNSKRVHIIGGVAIKPLFSESVDEKELNNPTVKALIANGDITVVSDKDAKTANKSAQDAVSELEAKELADLREEAKALGVKNTHNMGKEKLLENISKAKAAAATTEGQ